MATATLKAKLTLNDNQYQAGLRKAVTAAKAAGAKIKAGLSAGLKIGAGAGAIGAVLGGAVLSRGIKQAYDMGGALSDLMSKTSAAGESLQIMAQALKDAGLNAESAGDILNQMQRAIAEGAKGNKRYADAFAAIGINARALKGLRPEQQFEAIGSAINNIVDPAERAAASMKLFRGSGGDLLTLFADGNAMNAAAQTLGSQAKILADNAAAFDTVSDRLGHVGTKLNGFFIGAASTFLPAMQAVTAAMEKADFAKQGEEFGKGMQRAAEYLTGALGDPASLFAPIKNYLASMFLEIANQFVHFVEMAFKGIIGEIVASFNHAGAAITATMERVAENLPGNTTRADAQRRANEFGEQERDLRTRSNQYASEGDMKRAEEMAALANRALLNRNRQLKIAKGELTMAERIAEIKKRDGIEGYAQGLRGNKDNLLGLAPDRFGAGRFASKARQGAFSIRASGAAKLGEMMGPPDLRKKDPFAAFTTLGFGAGGLHNNGGLTSSGLGGAYNKIRRGDAAKAKGSNVKAPEEKAASHLEHIENILKEAYQ